MQIAENLDQFENSVFVIMGNKGEYMPYRYIPFFNLHRGDSPCTWGLQLTSQSEGRHTYLVSSLQMPQRKACSATETFPHLPRGSNTEPLAPEARTLTNLNSLLVKRQINNHSPGPVTRWEISP